MSASSALGSRSESESGELAVSVLVVSLDLGLGLGLGFLVRSSATLSQFLGPVREEVG